MCPVVFGKLYASRCLFPEFEMAIYAGSDQEILVLCYSDIGQYISVHKAFLIHFSAGQRIQVGLFMLQYLEKDKRDQHDTLCCNCN